MGVIGEHRTGLIPGLPSKRDPSNSMASVRDTRRAGPNLPPLVVMPGGNVTEPSRTTKPSAAPPLPEVSTLCGSLTDPVRIRPSDRIVFSHLKSARGWKNYVEMHPLERAAQHATLTEARYVKQFRKRQQQVMTWQNPHHKHLQPHAQLGSDCIPPAASHRGSVARTSIGDLGSKVGETPASRVSSHAHQEDEGAPGCAHSQSSQEESEHSEADVDDDGRRDPSASAFNPPPWSVIKKNNFSQVWQPPPHPPPKIAMYNANQRRRREMEAIKSEDIQARQFKKQQERLAATTRRIVPSPPKRLTSTKDITFKKPTRRVRDRSPVRRRASPSTSNDEDELNPQPVLKKTNRFQEHGRKSQRGRLERAALEVSEEEVARAKLKDALLAAKRAQETIKREVHDLQAGRASVEQIMESRKKTFFTPKPIFKSTKEARLFKVVDLSSRSSRWKSTIDTSKMRKGIGFLDKPTKISFLDNNNNDYSAED